MAVYINSDEINQESIPEMPQECSDAKYCGIDFMDESTGKWWGLYKWEGKVFRGKAHLMKHGMQNNS